MSGARGQLYFQLEKGLILTHGQFIQTMLYRGGQLRLCFEEEYLYFALEVLQLQLGSLKYARLLKHE